MKAAIVTGASAGIGLATAERFVNAGFAVTNLSAAPARCRPCATFAATSPTRSFWMPFRGS